MTADPREVITPKLERMSVLQVGFESTPKLNDALHRFLLPKFSQRKFVFKSFHERFVATDRSDNDGAYHEPDVEQRLTDDNRRLGAFAMTPIPITEVVYQTSPRGDLRIVVNLEPIQREREELWNTYVLSLQPHEKRQRLLAYTAIAAGSLLPRVDGEPHPAMLLRRDLDLPTKPWSEMYPEIDEADYPVENPHALYLTHPHIIRRTENLN